MPNTLVNIYHHFPSPMRNLAASARGYYLRRWRYGPETEKFVEEALERDQWSREQWKTWREERLAFMLNHAANHVPYYRQHWSERRQRGDHASVEILENWPILKKDDVRQNANAFVAEDCDPRKMYANATSGTTGMPITFYMRREALRLWYGIFEARMRHWHDVSIRERWAILGGQLVVPFDQKKPPYWVKNAGLNQLYMSTHHMTTKNADVYLEALRDFGPTHMITYPSSANFLATQILEQGLKPPALKVIFSNAEVLLDQQRETISKAFGCPVVNTYGMSELIAGASECKHGSMHLWPEIGTIEGFALDEDVPIAAGEHGRFIITGLLNADMPLIRYDMGDRGQLAADDATCACGRHLPIALSVDGRMNDMIVTADGRRIFWLNPVFYNMPVQEAQIIQETLTDIRVCVVPTPDYTPHTGETILQRLRERVGDMNMSVEIMDHVPRSKDGKLRGVISRISSTNPAQVQERDLV